MAAHEVPGLDLLERRLLLLADRPQVARAARVEHTTRGRLGRARDLALQPDRDRARSPSAVGTADSSASVYGCWGGANTVSAAPSSISRPRYRTAIRSDRYRTTPRSCEMNRYETPLSACSSTSRLRIAAWTDTSSAEVGSSQTTTWGSPANARAIATRCLRPPDSCAGRAPISGRRSAPNGPARAAAPRAARP